MESESGSNDTEYRSAGFLMSAGAEGENLRPALLAWIPRGTGTMSLVGSVLILWDIWVVRRQRIVKINCRLYAEIITAISVCDIFGSIAWILSTLPMPTSVEDKELRIKVNSNIYGAKGNELTCKLQAVFVQIGITGIFFFVSLTFYYVLTIKYGYREKRMNSLRWYFHLPPLLLGTLCIGASLAESDHSYVACYAELHEFLGYLFSRLPFWLAFAVTPIALFMTLMHVRTTDRKSNKWRYSNAEDSSRRMSQMAIAKQDAKVESSVPNIPSLSVGPESQPSRADSSLSVWSQENTEQPQSLKVQNDSAELNSAQDSVRSNVHPRNIATTSNSIGSRPPGQLTRAVFWQFILYLMSFWFTWPVFFLGKLDSLETNFAYLVVVVTITPLQGFFNSFVYFRPTVAKEYANWRQAKKAKILLKKIGTSNPSYQQPSPLNLIAEADEEKTPAGRAAAPVEELGEESVVEC